MRPLTLVSNIFSHTAVQLSVKVRSSTTMKFRFKALPVYSKAAPYLLH